MSTDIESPEIIEQEQPQEHYTENQPEYEESQEVECFFCQKKFKTKNPFEELCDECESANDKMMEEYAIEMKKKYPEYFDGK